MQVCKDMIKRQFACLVGLVGQFACFGHNSVTVNNFATFFNRMPIGRTSD